MDPVNVPAKFEVRSFTRSWDNRVLQEFGQSLDTTTLAFSQIFKGLVCMDAVNTPAKFEVRSFYLFLR